MYLYYIQLFTWYADMTNFVKNIRPTYAKILSFPSRYLVPIQLKKNAKARLAKYSVEITDDDKGLPQNEVEEMKELQRSGWHYVSDIRSMDREWSLISALDVSIGKRNICCPW